jgi:hypothetical protein
MAWKELRLVPRSGSGKYWRRSYEDSETEGGGPDSMATGPQAVGSQTLDNGVRQGIRDDPKGDSSFLPHSELLDTSRLASAVRRTS